MTEILGDNFVQEYMCGSLAEEKSALEGIVKRLGALAEEGRQVAILWDMDGTLVDTRPRMLAAVHTYGRTDVLLTDVSPSWQETAQSLGLCPKRFKAVWDRVFWAYESFDADIENEEVAALARLAESLGVQTVIVTGRIEELRPVTARQLERLGLRPTRVFLKSEVGDCTPSVKAEVISQLAAEGLHMGAFVTDCVEEIAAVTPDILAAAPDLACIFAELEGTSPTLPEGVHRFIVPFRNGSRMAEPPSKLEVGSGFLEFGFEAEYGIESADELLRLYEPTSAAGISPEQWRDWSARERASWVYDQFPKPHSEEFDLPLIRNNEVPELDFLTKGLFVDSDGNLEIVSKPTHDLAQMWNDIERLEHHCGSALLQVTISLPTDSLLDSETQSSELDGFLSFHHLLDTLERIDVGHTLFLENPNRDVLRPFIHPWLGPMTAGKQRFMRQYLEANARGERLDEKWVRLVDRAFSSFKYINGTAYRPALAGPDRVAFEIRDAHGNKPLLAQRLTRTAICLLSGLEPYAPFSQTQAFDSERDYETFPREIREMLESVIPSQERPEIDHMYSDYDRVALQVYRNFAMPLKDYSDVETALGQESGDPNLLGARQTYIATLEALAEEYNEREVEQVRRDIQGALAAFVGQSGLLDRMCRFSHRCLNSERALESSSRVQAFLPLTSALPTSSWRGSPQERIRRLQCLWPEQVGFHPNASLDLLSKQSIQAPILIISVAGLSVAERERLRTDFLNATARDTLGVRVTDRGSLEVRFGEKSFKPGAWAEFAQSYDPWLTGAGPEVIVTLSGFENYCLGRRLQAHQPCDEAARRISASGWLRHFSVGPHEQTLEELLDLPYPESIETAAQVFDRVLSCAKSRLGSVAQWTEQSIEEWMTAHGSTQNIKLALKASDIASGFPDSLRKTPAFTVRLSELVRRWPGCARLVKNVPFAFGEQEKPRTVLVLSLAGLNDEQFEEFRLDYLDAIGWDTISFPCRLRAEHLRARVGTLALALSAEGVRVDFYAPPWRRRRMEAVVELEPDEVLRMRNYLGAVIDNTLGMLGPITLGAGSRTTKGLLNDNRPTDNGQHNCTTWVTLAPVGEDGKDLATLVEMPQSWTSHDNPGWWSMFLSGASRSTRTSTVIYWTDLPLDEEPCATGQMIPWDFNPH